MNPRIPLSVFSSALLVLTAALFQPNALANGGTDGLKGLEWRHVGPYRGGRVTTVTGVPGRPNL